MKKEVFIEKAVAVHGYKYDYSLLPDEFKTSDKVPVLCKKHGEFLVTTGNHINNKRACPKCGFEHVANIKKQKSKNEFFELSPVLHNNKYDYSLVEYVDSKTKVKIICPIHGVFEQIPYSHMQGQGCFSCGRAKSAESQKHTTESFIEKSRNTHGDTYDYSEVDYVNQQTKVKIICKEHGPFLQKPNNHINGNGCPSCLPQKLREKFMMSVEEFRERVLELHPSLDVDFESYSGCHAPVKAFCKVHGDFEQQGRHLLLGHGCSKCGYERNAIARSKGDEYFVPLFKQVHGDVYDYSETKFTNSKQKFTVICKTHGPFKATTHNHLKGRGCPKCGTWKCGYRSNRRGTFYILKVTDDVCKFGISNVFPERLKSLQLNSCFDLETMYLFEFEDGQIARDIESELIESDLIRCVVNPADMKSGYTETFYLSDISKVLQVVAKHKPAI